MAEIVTFDPAAFMVLHVNDPVTTTMGESSRRHPTLVDALGYIRDQNDGEYTIEIVGADSEVKLQADQVTLLVAALPKPKI